jgi:UDPglucose 6-dehydrogenase
MRLYTQGMQKSQDKPLVGFAGLTHLGIVTATTTAARGYDVICYHNGPWGELNKEPDLAELLNQYKYHLVLTMTPRGLNECDIVFVTLDVPLNDQNEPDFEPVQKLIYEIILHIKSDATLVIMSQVPPGFTRKINFPKERLFYQVETLIFGESVSRALLPERIIVGCADPNIWTDVYEDFLHGFGCPIFFMSYESAELSKIAINTLLVASISTTNMLAEFAAFCNADWNDVIPVLQSDKRFGPYAYVKPGLGLGGGHIERDLHTLLATNFPVEKDLLEAFLRQSHLQRTWLMFEVARAQKICFPEDRIAILGLAYKPGTASTRNSAGMDILNILSGEDPDCVIAHDPIVKHPRCVDSIFECVKDADILVVATPWSEYREIGSVFLKTQMRGNVIIDPYRVFDGPALVQLGFEYHTLGAAPIYPTTETK